MGNFVKGENMKKIFLCFVLPVITMLCAAGVKGIPQENKNMDIEKRVDEILSKMTLKEKVRMTGGKLSIGFTGYIPSNEKLGIPQITLTDGPVGVRMGKSTAFPVSIVMASTWNTELIEKLGGVLGREALARQQVVLLGPCVNIVRVPLGGRSFESFGEDPYLASRITVPYIVGVQKEGVIAEVKHYCCNNQEWDRMSVDAKIDERTLHEIYLPAFRAAVQEAGVWSVMAAYNKVNGQHAAENEYLLNDVLKNQWGFQGFVVSDWGATHNTIASALNGLDMEMPGNTHFGAKLTRAVENGKVPESVVDDKVRRILRALMAMGMFDRKTWLDQSVAGSEEHRKIAYEVAAEGIVLLKNKGALPLSAGKIKSVAIIGPHANSPETGGGGSSRVNPTFVQTPLDAFKKKAGETIQIHYAKGSSIREKNDVMLQEAVDAAKKSDAAIVFAGLAADIESEGFDRESLDMPEAQKELISAVAKANKNTVVVLYAGAPVLMEPWLNKVSAILLAWYPGQEGAGAVADILFGSVNPSGKLPETFPMKLEDTPGFKTYPGKDGATQYSEGIFVGYRHYDAKNLAVLFPFGYGLSYTAFKYDKLKITPDKISAGGYVDVTFNITNTGKVEGAETAQVYVRDIKSSVPRPPKELKGFIKGVLKPGETKTVSILLNEDAFSFYDVNTKKFIMEPGEFEILIGASSREIRLKVKVKISG